MAKYTVLTPDAQHDDDHRVEREVAGGDVEFINYNTADASDIPDETWEKIDALLVWHVLPIDQRVLSRLKNCRIIVRCGVGFDHIDLAAAGTAGIPVSNCPDYGTNEVADHAIAMMLTFSRGLTAYHRTMTADPVGNFHWKHGEPRRIRHKTFGVVGFGRIGTAALKRMKSDAILINTARGPIVDTAALLEALRNDEIAAAGLDVLPVEPATLDDPLVRAFAEQPDWLKDRLILTPHAAFNSEAGRYDARANSTRTMMRYLETGELWNCVNGAFLNR